MHAAAAKEMMASDASEKPSRTKDSGLVVNATGWSVKWNNRLHPGSAFDGGKNWYVPVASIVMLSSTAGSGRGMLGAWPRSPNKRTVESKAIAGA